MIRTDRHNHRPAVPDSDLAGAVKVLARAQQSMIWNRWRQAPRSGNRPQDHLLATKARREYSAGIEQAWHRA
jgi:hypothetical protein